MQKVEIIGKNVKNIEILLSNIFSDLENKLTTSIDFTIKIRLHATRNSFNKQIGRKTYEWEVGITSSNNEIDIIHEDSFEKYSSHKKESFSKILKHEISHIFIRKLANGKTIPLWLNEGLSMYLANQMEQYKNEGIFIENNYISKISTEYGWNKYSNYSAYAYSCLFVEYLINKYSLEKIIELIKNLRKNYSLKTFNLLFTNIFDKEIEKVESDFLESLK